MLPISPDENQDYPLYYTDTQHKQEHNNSQYK